LILKGFALRRSPLNPFKPQVMPQSDSKFTILFTKKLESSGLSRKDASVLKMSVMTGAQMKQFGLPEGYAIKIPYFTPDGRTTDFIRFRYLEDTRNGFERDADAKPLRYIQRAGTINELYLPSVIDWQAVCGDVSIPLILTEGELKSACACINGIPTIGLGGVWCFRSAKSGMKSIPAFKWVEWRNREVTILFDSDAATNPDVRSAENALAELLTSLGAKPRIARLPNIEGFEKTGLDDYIVELGAEALQAVLKQAEAFLGSELLHKLNSEVVYVRDPGLIVRLNSNQRMSPNNFTQHAFSTWSYVQQVETRAGSKLAEKSAPKEWLRWAQRSEVERATYAPGRPRFHDRLLNVWPGWGAEPKPGPVGLWEKLLDNIFGNEDDAREWFCQWLACPIQHPGTKMYSAALLWGRNQGTGKSLIGITMGKIYGRNYEMINEKMLTAPFNEWAENKQFILIDDIDGRHNRENDALIRGMITRQELRLNPKYIPSYSIPDCINYMGTSNKADAFFIEDEDRRIFVQEVMAERLPKEFVDEYDAWLKSGDCGSAMFHWALNVDLKGFRPNAPALTTKSKLAMIEDCRSDVARWVAVLMHDPEQILKKMGQPLPYELWRTEDLLKLYDPGGQTRLTSTGLSRALKAGGMERAARGHQCVTVNGKTKIWIRPLPKEEMGKYLYQPDAQIGRMYDEERAVHDGGMTINGHKLEAAPVQKKGKPLGFDLYQRRREKKQARRGRAH
jgi:Domain of unknown function (DUF3854)/Family of unknown function (DUF5906)